MSNQASFRCDSCQRSYKWRADWAGKTVKCKCGESITVPRQTAASESTEPVASRSKAKRDRFTKPSETRCPKCRAAVSADAVLCVNCGTMLNGDLDAPVAATASHVNTPDGKKNSLSRNSRMLAAVGGGVGLLAVIVVAAILMSGGEDTPIEPPPNKNIAQVDTPKSPTDSPNPTDTKSPAPTPPKIDTPPVPELLPPTRPEIVRLSIPPFDMKAYGAYVAALPDPISVYNGLKVMSSTYRNIDRATVDTFPGAIDSMLTHYPIDYEKAAPNLHRALMDKELDASVIRKGAADALAGLRSEQTKAMVAWALTTVAADAQNPAELRIHLLDRYSHLMTPNADSFIQALLAEIALDGKSGIEPRVRAMELLALADSAYALNALRWIAADTSQPAPIADALPRVMRGADPIEAHRLRGQLAADGVLDPERPMDERFDRVNEVLRLRGAAADAVIREVLLSIIGNGRESPAARTLAISHVSVIPNAEVQQKLATVASDRSLDPSIVSRARTALEQFDAGGFEHRTRRDVLTLQGDYKEVGAALWVAIAKVGSKALAADLKAMMGRSEDYQCWLYTSFLWTRSDHGVNLKVRKRMYDRLDLAPAVEAVADVVIKKACAETGNTPLRSALMYGSRSSNHWPEVLATRMYPYALEAMRTGKPWQPHIRLELYYEAEIVLAVDKPEGVNALLDRFISHVNKPQRKQQWDSILSMFGRDKYGVVKNHVTTQRLGEIAMFLTEKGREQERVTFMGKYLERTTLLQEVMLNGHAYELHARLADNSTFSWYKEGMIPEGKMAIFVLRRPERIARTTAAMPIKFDVMYVTEDGTVDAANSVTITSRLGADTSSASKGAVRYIVSAPLGTIAATGIKVGDKLPLDYKMIEAVGRR